MLGDDDREYVITSDSDIADKVTRISNNNIHIATNSYYSEIDNICVKLVKPEPLSEVPMKDILLES